MAWIIQSDAQGPVIINDIGITLTHRQIRDLDLIGRQNAERSVDLKLMFQKGFIREIKKDAFVEGQVSTEAIKKINETVEASNLRIHKLEEANVDLTKKVEETNKLAKTVLEEVRQFAEKKPLDIQVIAEAMRAIMAERGNIAIQREELQTSGLSEAEIKAKNKILELQDKKLEKNITNLGNTISHTGSDLKENLDALDALDI